MLDSPGTDTVRTVRDTYSASVLILGSKFLAHLAPASSESDCERLLRTRISRYPDASHHCWALRTGRPSELIERSSDAGEPSGTAGRPILDALRSQRLENVACIVTRYFGGTKLGKGGLVRAYSDAAYEVISQSVIVERAIVQTVYLGFEHVRTGIVYRVLAEFGVRFVQDDFDELTHGHIEVPVSRVVELQTRLRDLSHSGIEWREGEVVLK